MQQTSAERAAQIVTGDRRALAQAITLVESGRADHRAKAADLLAALPPGNAMRIGLTGTPGVGKSTFIETFGLMLTASNLRVAVLAVDPSSSRSGGSILGDKTRMERLARDPRAFIRPSPSQSHMGGVARHTREAAALLDGAGYDVILIETVGVGQSEAMVAGMVDLFILLMAPAGGDELQGVKRGIIERADLILVNKADGDLRAAATRTAADYASALRLLRRRPQDPEGFPKTLLISALEGRGLAEAWADMQELTRWRREQGHWANLRADQARDWFEALVRQALMDQLTQPGPVADALASLGQQVAEGRRDPQMAAESLLALLNRG